MLGPMLIGLLGRFLDVRTYLRVAERKITGPIFGPLFGA